MLRVKMAKLSIMPSVIPSGFLCPPETDEDKIIGKSGQIQGAKIVMSPERKAKRSRISISITIALLWLNNKF